MTGRLISDTPEGKILLSHISALKVKFYQGNGKRGFRGQVISIQPTDLNGDGILDLVAKIRTSSLRGIQKGKGTVTVSDRVVTESATVKIT